jgi:hypothetical protein
MESVSPSRATGIDIRVASIWMAAPMPPTPTNLRSAR